MIFTEKEQSTQAAIKTPAGSVCVALVDYQAMGSNELSFSKEEELEITDTSGSYHWWIGRSLLSGSEGYIPTSCVLSMLDSHQLLQFVLTEQKVSLPTILQKIKDDSCSNDDKPSRFLKSISDDIILLTALRQDKWQHEGKGIMCGWVSFDFFYGVNCL